MNRLPLEIVREVAGFLLEGDKDKYCIFSDESTPLRLSCKCFSRELSKLQPCKWLLDPCVSVKEMCKSECYYWTVEASQRCTYHCHEGQPKQFMRWEVHTMREMTTSLLEQINNAPDSVKGRNAVFSGGRGVAELRMPSLEFLSNFLQFLEQCKVYMNNMSVCAVRSSAEIKVVWSHKYDLNYEF